MPAIKACLDEWGLGWVTESVWNTLYAVVGIAFLIGNLVIGLTTPRGWERLTKYWEWWLSLLIFCSLPWTVPWIRARCVPWIRARCGGRARPNPTAHTHQDVWGGDTELAAV